MTNYFCWLRQRFRELEISRVGAEKTRPEESEESLRAQEDSPSAFVCSLTCFIDIRAHLGSKIAKLEKTVQDLRHELVASQRAASQKEDSLSEIIKSLHADLHTQQMKSGALVDTIPRAFLTGFLLSTSIKQNKKTANLEKTVQERSNQLATSNQEKDVLNKTINSLRAEHQSSCAFIATLMRIIENHVR